MGLAGNRDVPPSAGPEASQAQGLRSPVLGTAKDTGDSWPGHQKSVTMVTPAFLHLLTGPSALAGRANGGPSLGLASWPTHTPPLPTVFQGQAAYVGSFPAVPACGAGSALLRRHPKNWPFSTLQDSWGQKAPASHSTLSRVVMSAGCSHRGCWRTPCTHSLLRPAGLFQSPSRHLIPRPLIHKG